MMMQLVEMFNRASLKVQGLVALISLGFYFLSSFFLEKSYVLSKFPVPYFEQQTSFDAAKMKEWYAFMLEQGTFDIYLTTQMIDFAFIATVIIAGFALWRFVANLHPKENFFNRWGQKLAYALPLAGLFDVLENLVSFFMIARPADFADLLLLPYSTFATVKFGCWTVGVTWLVIALVGLFFVRISVGWRAGALDESR